MPKPTFYNLPRGKSEAVIGAAIDEFADKDYEGASIARIVEASGISRGSFYQYFEDKRDLYEYLLDIILEERLAIVEEGLAAASSRASDGAMRAVLELGILGGSSSPKRFRILYRAMFGDSPLRDETARKIRGAINEPIRRVIAESVARKSMRADIDPDVAAYILNLVMSDFLNGSTAIAQAGSKPRGGKMAAAADDSPLRERIASLSDILWNGLRKR